MTNVFYEIEKVDVSNLDDNDVQQLYLVDSSIGEKYNFLPRFRNSDEYKDKFLSMFVGSTDNDLFVIKSQSIITGILSFVKAADWSKKERYELTVRLCEDVVNESLTSCLQRFVDEKLSRCDYFALITYNNELDELIGRYLAKVDKKSNTYTLAKEDIKLDLLDKPIREFQVKNGDLRMVYTDVISEEYIEQYCDLFMETMEDMPDGAEEGYVRYVITPEDQRKLNEDGVKKDGAHHCYMIFNSDGVMVAKSNVSVNNNDPRFPYQFMIGVKREYRGRSLAKWMYAYMYKRLFEDVDFEKVLVHHHPENKSAIVVSEWVGYKFAYFEVTHVLGD